MHYYFGAACGPATLTLAGAPMKTKPHCKKQCGTMPA